MKKIPLFKLEAQIEQIKAEVFAKWDKAINRSEFTYGKYVQELETQATQFFQTKYALGVASGTASLFIALKAAGVEPGDEVITTPLTFCATADAIKHVGAKPVFVDVVEKTGNLDPQEVEQAISKKTKAILLVHLYGVPCQLNNFQELAEKNKLLLIEDASHAHGSLYQGKPVGGWGLAGCFSLYPSKIIGAFGNAGLIISNKKSFIKKAKMYAHHGIKNTESKHLHYLHGYNELIDNLQAAVVVSKFKTIDQIIKKKRELASNYNEIFQQKGHPGMFWPEETKPSLYVYSIQIKNRAVFIKHMQNRGIETGVYYRKPLHLQPAFSELGYQQGDLPRAEKFFRQTVSLPLYPELTEKELGRIETAIKDFL